MAAEPARQDRERRGAPTLSVIHPTEASRRTPLAVAIGAAAIFSIAAGSIHAATIHDQFQESWLYGISFVAFAVGQIGWGFLAARYPSRPLLLVGLAGNALVMVIWALTRMAGAFVGPFAKVAIPVGFPDAFATTLEGLAVVSCVAGLVASRSRRTLRRPAAAGVWVTAAAIAVPLATLAILSQLGVLPSLTPSY